MRYQTRNKIILALAISFMFLTPTTLVLADTNSIKTNSEEMFDFNYVNENELIITYNLQDLQQNQIIVDNEIYTNFQIKNTGFLGNIGKPQLPIISKIIAVPRTDVSIEIINTESEIKKVGKIYPAQSLQTDNLEKYDFIIEESFYKEDNTYPGKVAEIVNYGKIRDIPFLKIELYPLNYNAKQELATIYNEITIKLTWDNVVVSVESGFENAQFLNFYKNTFLNWQEFLENTQISEKPQNTGRDPGADYILITYDDFYNESKNLADWKHSKGYMTELVNFSDIGTTSDDIQQYIQNAYDSWNPRPSFVCLVGDAEYIPTNYEYSAASDLWYVTVSGSDYYPDMNIGRIPADTADEANVMIQKILNYEQNPPTLPEFYENFTVAAYFQDDEQDGYETRRFVRTSEEVRDFLLAENYTGERIYVTESYINPTHYNNDYYGNGEPLPEELLRPTFAWDGDATDVINAIERGVFILNHRDHGSTGAWGDPYFDIDHIGQLTNGDLLPVVFSLNCLTGSFDTEECFCEEFVRKEDGGAVAIIGATRTSYSGYNDYFCRGLYDAMWPDFDDEIGDDTALYTLGEMLNYGKVYMANTWGDEWGYERLTFELFHVFCDPTLQIWSAFPEELEISYVTVEQGLVVTVSDRDGVIEGALVGISQESGFYANGYTDSTGNITLDTSSAIPEEEVTLGVTAHNYLPYVSTFFLNQRPEIPDKPDGPLTGQKGTEYTFSASTTDPDGDQIYYMWRWGDGQYSEWLGPYNSGDTISTAHKWSDTGNFQVRLKAKDTNELETDWSESHIINIKKSKEANWTMFRILQIFPNLYALLKTFLGF